MFSRPAAVSFFAQALLLAAAAMLTINCYKPEEMEAEARRWERQAKRQWQRFMKQHPDWFRPLEKLETTQEPAEDDAGGDPAGQLATAIAASVERLLSRACGDGACPNAQVERQCATLTRPAVVSLPGQSGPRKLTLRIGRDWNIAQQGNTFNSPDLSLEFTLAPPLEQAPDPRAEVQILGRKFVLATAGNWRSTKLLEDAAGDSATVLVTPHRGAELVMAGLFYPPDGAAPVTAVMRLERRMIEQPAELEALVCFILATADPEGHLPAEKNEEEEDARTTR